LVALVGEVLNQRALLVVAEALQLALNEDVGSLLSSLIKVEVFGLNANELLISRQQGVSNGVDDCRLAGVVPPNQRRYSTVKRDVECRVAVSKLAEVLDRDVRQMHAFSMV